MILEALLIMTLVILIICVLVFDREIKKHKQEILDLQTTLYLSKDKLKRMEGHVCGVRKRVSRACGAV